jgi:glucose/mannose-6-phosphate isomerase
VSLYRIGFAPGGHANLAYAQQQLAARRAKCLPEVDGAANPAREVARKIGRTIPIIYGGGALGGVAAYRWKCDVNENAKAPAFWHHYPELDHNEITGKVASRNCSISCISATGRVATSRSRTTSIRGPSTRSSS